MLDAFDSTYSQLVAFYLSARLFMGSYCLIVSFLVPMVKGMMILQAIIVLIPSSLWIGSIYVDMPKRLALIWIAIFLDLTLMMTGIIFVQQSNRISKSLGKFLEKAFEFLPATNIEHKTERINAFVTLVFGYSVVAVIYQSATSFGLNAFFGKAVMGLFQAFCFNWIYFELDGAELFQHAIRRSMLSGEHYSCKYQNVAKNVM
jgi:low temperature requirement protein LtrA